MPTASTAGSPWCCPSRTAGCPPWALPPFTGLPAAPPCVLRPAPCGWGSAAFPWMTRAGSSSSSGAPAAATSAFPRPTSSPRKPAAAKPSPHLPQGGLRRQMGAGGAHRPGPHGPQGLPGGRGLPRGGGPRHPAGQPASGEIFCGPSPAGPCGPGACSWPRP